MSRNQKFSTGQVSFNHSASFTLETFIGVAMFIIVPFSPDFLAF